jgi:ABC-type transport system involved in multi-copper enzyme maturation permease subunit
MFITNEYTYKTHRQNIIDGWSRQQFLTAKLINVIMISLLTTMLFTIVALVIGSVNRTDENVWENSKYIPLFALQSFAQLSIAFFIAFLARKAFIALGIFLFYFIILEPIIVGLGKWKLNDAGRFMPLEISDRLIPVPAFLGRFDEQNYKIMMASINQHVIYTIIMIALVWAVCFWINNRRDL